MTYDLFISYAHADDAQGWVTMLCDALVADHSSYRSGETLDVFFDTHSLHHMHDWEHHILRSLQESRLFVAVLSPRWYGSPFCRRELREYLDRRTRSAVAGEGLSPVYFIEAPAQDEGWIDDPGIEAEVAWCREQFQRTQTRMEPWFPAGEMALADDEVRLRVGRIAEHVMPPVQERLDRARIAESVQGNVRATTPTFVGRTTHIRALHDAASLTAPGTVALLHGPGGFGKTELAVAYANEYRAGYGGGVWQVSAESTPLPAGQATAEARVQAGQVSGFDRDSKLLAALGTLAWDLGVMLSDEERANQALAGRAVVAHLRARVRRAQSEQVQREASMRASGRPVTPVRQAALVILDNLDDPSLLGKRQRSQISASDWAWLRVVATTRLAPGDFASAAHSMRPVEVGPLTAEESLLLMREHQPPRQPGGVRRFANPAQAEAAREIAGVLGVLTLVVEQVAVHLGLGRGHPPQYVEPTEYLTQLLEAGVVHIDAHVRADDTEFDAMAHQEPIMAHVMDTAFAELPEDAAMALKVASLLPADAVPWPWVARIVTGRGAQAPPARVRQLLTGRRLLAPTSTDQLLRIHRLHSAHLAASAAQFEPDVVALIGEVVESTDPDGAAQVWQLQAILDAALPRLADGSSGLTAASWGDFIQAAYSYLGAAVLPLAEALVAARRALHDAAPDNQTYQRDLAIGLGVWARLVQDFDTARADNYYKESVTLHRALHEAAPDNQTYQRCLAIGLDDWARLVQFVETARADDMYRESVDLRRTLYTDEPDNCTYQRDLATGLGTWAWLVQDVDAARADEMYRESVDLFRALRHAEPDNRTYQQALAALLGNWARLIQKVDVARADDTYRESVDLFRALHHGTPESRAAQRDLAIGLGTWAGLVHHDDVIRADEMYREAFDLFRALRHAEPDNRTYQQALAALLGNWARLIETVDVARADDIYRESVDLFRALHHGTPENRTYQEGLAMILVDSAIHRQRLNKHVPTSDWVDACQLWTALAAARRLTNGEDQYRLRACFWALRDHPVS